MQASETTVSLPDISSLLEIRRPEQPSLWLWARTCPTRGCGCRDALITVSTQGPSAALELRARVLETLAVAESHVALARALDADVPCALDEGEYVAIDHHCPDPTCECRQMIVEFSQDDDIAAMRVQPDGRFARDAGAK